jgi:hypothetical protein
MSVLPDASRAPARVSADTFERFALPGFFATSMIAVGALVVGWVAPLSDLASNPLLMAARDSVAATSVAKLVVIVGAGWLLRTWLALGVHVRGLDVRGARSLGWLALLWSVPLLVSPVLFSRDVFSYVAASRLMPAGFDPYAVGTGALPTYVGDGADPMWAESPAPYGPLWMGLSSVLHGVTTAQPDAALLGFRLLAVAGIVLMVLFVPRLAEAAGTDVGFATWLAVLNPVVLFHLSSAAHNDALMVGLLVAGVAFATQRRIVLATLLVALAGAVKAPALVALPFVGLIWVGTDAAWRRKIVTWASLGVATVATTAVLSLVTGLSAGWVQNLSNPAKVETWLSPATALGRTLGFVAEWLGVASADGTLHVVRMSGTLATAALVGWLLLTAHRRTALQGLAVALLALVALGPVVQPWYLLWALPFVAVSGLDATQVRWAVGLSLGLSAYTVANTAATTTTLASLPEGIAALLAGAVVAAMLFVPRTTRSLLLPARTALAPVSAPSSSASIAV